MGSIDVESYRKDPNERPEAFFVDGRELLDIDGGPWNLV